MKATILLLLITLAAMPTIGPQAHKFHVSDVHYDIHESDTTGGYGRTSLFGFITIEKVEITGTQDGLRYQLTCAWLNDGKSDPCPTNIHAGKDYHFAFAPDEKIAVYLDDEAAAASLKNGSKPPHYGNFSIDIVTPVEKK